MSTATATETRVKIARPTLHQVVLLNDDFTPMEFVIDVITNIFGRTLEDAQAITMLIHDQGEGIVGVYTREVAENKVKDTIDIARKCSHPLRAVARPAV